MLNRLEACERVYPKEYDMLKNRLAREEVSGLFSDLTDIVNGWPEYTQAIMDVVRERGYVPNGSVAFNRNGYRWGVHRHGNMADGRPSVIEVKAKSLDDSQLDQETDRRLMDRYYGCYGEGEAVGERYFDILISMKFVPEKSTMGMSSIWFQDEQGLRGRQVAGGKAKKFIDSLNP